MESLSGAGNAAPAVATPEADRGEEGSSETKSGAAGELLFWNKSLQPTGLEGEGYFLDVVPKVDAVDFHDPGEEEEGNFDLIEDPVTEETYKVARDQAIEFYSSGSGPRLKKARERYERSLTAIKRREDTSGSFASDESISSSGEDSEGGGGRIEPRKNGRGEPGPRGDAAAVAWQEETFWSDASSGVFASSSTSSDSSVADESSDDGCRGGISGGQDFGADAGGLRRRQRYSGKGKGKDKDGGREGEGGDACGSNGARSMLPRRDSDSEKFGAEDEEDGREGALAELGLQAEFLPLAMGGWEDVVCLGDADRGGYASRRKKQARTTAASVEPGVPPVSSPASLLSTMAMSVSSPTASGDEEDGAKRALKTEKGKEKEKHSNKDKEGGKSGGDAAAAAAAVATAAAAAAAKEKKATIDGATDGKRANKNPLKNALAKAKRTPGLGAEFQQKAAAFPAREGQPWVDPPLILNPQIDGGDWEADVLLNDSQKPRKPKIPVYLDDPDMLFGEVRTPRPKLKILQTEAQQENTHILERTNRRQMAREKQKRLRDAAFKTGYTINTLGEGKASRAESNVRAVVIRPPPHSSPAEDKVLIAPPKSWEEIRNLHRPRIPLSSLVPTQREPKPLQRGQQGGALGPRIGDAVAMPMHREKDLLPLDSRSTFVMMEYVEERPPLLGSTGMATKIVTFARSSSRRTIMSGEPIQNVAAAGFGERRELTPQEDSPFLGEIRPGTEQPAICNGLFRAPIFKHYAPDSDFLLIREPLSKRERERMSQDQKQKEKAAKQNTFFADNGAGSAAAAAAAAAKPRLSQFYVVRPMPVVFLVGQTEPQIEALEPTKPSSRTTHLNIVSFLAKRLFDTTKIAQADNPGIPFKKVVEEAKFLSLPRAKDATKARLKEVVRDIAERRDMKDDPDGPVDSNSLWSAKPDRDLQQETAQAAKLFRCEDVCALESMVSAWAHLCQIGVDSLTSHEAVAKALVKIKTRHDTLSSQVKEVRAAATALAKRKSTFTRAAKLRKLPPPDPNEGLSKQLAGMEKLAEVLGAQLTELKRVRAVAQYMHKELQMVPWTLTVNYLKHRGMGSSQTTSLLRLSGDGDPSGCGEAFSFLMRQAEQVNTSSAMTSSEKLAADRSVQKVTGTSGDLRRLTMLQLASTCEAMGIPKDTVKTLRRWDRVHMIKELAGVAVAENVQDQNIYARFVRRRRPNATIDKDLYRATCNEIWERQASALSATEPDDLDYGSESTGKGKSRAKARSAASSEEYDDDGLNDDFNDVLNDDDLDDDGLNDDDLMDDMEETLEEGDGDGDTPIAKSLQDLTASATRDREELDDERQLRQLQKDLQHEDRGDASRWGAAPEEEAPQKSQMEDLLAKLGGRAEIPKQAVRRIVRTIGPDGTETVKVSYSLRRQDLVRLDARGGKKQTSLSKSGGSSGGGSRGGPGGGPGTAGSSPLGFFLPRPQASAEVKAAALQERAANGGQEEVLKIRLTPKTILAPNDKKRKRSSREGARKAAPEENIYAMKRQNSRRLTVESRDRLPRNRMRNLLSAVIKKLAERQDSLSFRAPVNKNIIPDYYVRIKKPMDLRTMAEKNNSYEYGAREALMADMRQMADNAVTYNGPDHALVKTAHTIVADCEVQLQDPEIEKAEKELCEERQASTKKSRSKNNGFSSGGGGSSGSGGKKAKTTPKKSSQAQPKARSVGGATRPEIEKNASSQNRAKVSTNSNANAVGTIPIVGSIAVASTTSQKISSTVSSSSSSSTSGSTTAASGNSARPPLTTAPEITALPTPARSTLVARTSLSGGGASGAGGSVRIKEKKLPQSPTPRMPPRLESVQQKQQQQQQQQQQRPHVGASVDPVADGGTSSDSSDGEEVVEAGGRIVF